MPYEEGMSISYDQLTGELTVYFRGQKTVLGRFRNYAEARQAGEAYCRKHGWNG